MPWGRYAGTSTMSSKTPIEPDFERQRFNELQRISLDVSKLTVSCLSQRSVPNAIRLAEQACAQADQFSDAVLAQAERLHAENADVPLLDCKKGCSYCCNIRVSATPMEVLKIAALIDQSFSAEQRAALMQRIDAYSAELKDLKGVERFSRRIPCPLLEDHACSIHTARPIACRAHHSTDVELCKRADEGEQIGVPGYRDIGLLMGSVVKGLQEGISQSQKIGQRVRLPESLKIALENPDCGQKWLDGSAPFPRETLPPVLPTASR